MTEKRLIDANAFLEELKAYYCSQVETESQMQYGVAEAIHMLRLAPTEDAVEVVWCKDCKHTAVTSWGERFCNRKWVEGLDELNENDFCSYGERKNCEV